MSNASYGAFPRPTDERAQVVAQRIQGVRERVKLAAARSKEIGGSGKEPRLVAVSKLHPPSAIMAAYVEAKQVHFGENYVQELVEKAKVLPAELRWHFVGGLQSNKGKALAAIPNLYLLETLDSVKAANVLEKALAAHDNDRKEPLRVYIQVNTSGEAAKSGVQPLLSEADLAKPEHPLIALARHVIATCPHILFLGLMTIGAASNSASADSSKAASGREEIIKANPDFERLITSRRLLVKALRSDQDLGKAVEANTAAKSVVLEFYKTRLLGGGEREGGLELSMGMSADLETATMAGSDNVRVGSDCFGQRAQTRDEAMRAMEHELKQ
ncbi:hypothetical protein K437DRAFT_255289 [Tilletiaria anomala UBC 951]|uniref:Pyridoxal phosphate homeostasis protein n=1 Tax=Tilletiaria anomala (strain ATCC 24038 / CBS 436.72 / UBC 951) TaxID=1037660 RepID=A0A066WEU2_TILAU|nr:uncharacterized protein K437DRAFT_255289 [Tilletiaria anomala UBC 951]KDN49609.1 hypothetical protein K437DRAFT_255289 [Tilletiaria anomala UBC 951]